MEKIIKSIRIYTGSGYEDFTLGEGLSGKHIAKSDFGKVILIARTNTAIVITFEGYKQFFYFGLSYRIIYE